jgi:signal transduction histidine kinase
MKKLLLPAVARLDRSPARAAALAAVLLAAVGAVHHALGWQYSFAFFYIVPIIVASRFLGRGAGVGVSLLASGVWFLDDFLAAAPHYASPGIAYWNLAGRLCVFLTVAVIVSGLERDVRSEHGLSEVKSEVLSLASHQFSNALTTMGLVMLLLDEDDDGGSRRRRELHAILKRNIDVLKGLVLNFLNEARLESGRIALEPRPTDLGAAVRDAAGALSPMSAQKGLQVLLDLAAGDMTVETDPDALNLILTNLLGNAIKYTPAGGTIAVGARGEGRPPGGFQVWVEDSGIGMTEEESRRALEGFRRAEPAKKMAKGFGLGLKVTSELLLSQGVRLDVRSAPGKGSRFSFVLPARGGSVPLPRAAAPDGNPREP